MIDIHWEASDCILALTANWCFVYEACNYSKHSHGWLWYDFHDACCANLNANKLSCMCKEWKQNLQPEMTYPLNGHIEVGDIRHSSQVSSVSVQSTLALWKVHELVASG